MSYLCSLQCNFVIHLGRAKPSHESGFWSKHKHKEVLPKFYRPNKKVMFYCYFAVQSWSSIVCQVTRFTDCQTNRKASSKQKDFLFFCASFLTNTVEFAWGLNLFLYFFLLLFLIKNSLLSQVHYILPMFKGRQLNWQRPLTSLLPKRLIQFTDMWNNGLIIVSIMNNASSTAEPLTGSLTWDQIVDTVDKSWSCSYKTDFYILEKMFTFSSFCSF